MRLAITGEEEPRILEIGAGTGSMLLRLLEHGLLRRGTYYALDASAENVICAQEALRQFAGLHSYDLREADGCLELHLPDGVLVIHFECADIFDRLPAWQAHQPFNLVIANAVLDLLDLTTALPLLRGVLQPGGKAHFTINFDGISIFEPVLDEALDAQILALYHRSMDERVVGGSRSGDSRSGRHLFHLLPASGFEILAVGSSDWVVYPRAGQYPQDEAYFLECILHFFEETLRNHPELDAKLLDGWLAQRRAQIARGELVYIAHQIDFFAQRAG